MPEKDPCDICQTLCETLPATGDSIHQNCPKCGQFILTGNASSNVSLSRRGKPIDHHDLRRRLRGHILAQNRAGAVPLINNTELTRLSRRPLPGFVERANVLLVDAVARSKTIKGNVDLEDEKLIGSTYSLNINELAVLRNHLIDRGFLDTPQSGQKSNILPEGYIYVEELLKTTNETSNVGFVAMWFDNEMNDAHINGLHPGIANAGYDPLRIDKTEHIKKIDDEIIAGIRQSRFLVADFSGHRGGVYFEAGYAMGIGLPVVWTCRKSDMLELHFDIRQYNCIDWTTPEELSERLQHRIEATVGKGLNA